MTDHAVLVFSIDPFAAALLGAAIELAGLSPVFAADGESPRDALLRTRPAFALVDCDHEPACSESFFGPAMMIGARAAVFSSPRSARPPAWLSSTYGVRVLHFPDDLDALASFLRERRSPAEA